MAKTQIDPEMDKEPKVPITPEQIAAISEDRRVSSLKSVQQQEAQRSSRAQAATQAQRSGWVAEAQAQAKASTPPKQPSVPPLSRDWKPEQSPLSIPAGTPSVQSPSMPFRPSGPTRQERLQQNIRDAEQTFREGKFLGMAPPEWVTNRPGQMNPNQSPVEQMQQPPQPGPVPLGSPSPNRPPAPMGLGDMLQQQGQPTPMGLGRGGQALPFNYDPNKIQRMYEQEQAMSSPAARQRSSDYDAARESLRKAAATVAADPRFSAEQRTAAFERIRGKMQELDANFAEGQDLMQSPSGFDQPPPEEFGLLQPGGLQPVGGGQLRNPETGDILETVRGPNGEVLPVNLRQPEIDALPPGTRYLDQSGKVQISGEATGRGRGSTQASGVAGARGEKTPQMPGTFATQEEAFAAYEKWAAKQVPGTTPGERSVTEAIIASIPDADVQDEVRAQVAGDPEAAAEILQQHAGFNVADRFEEERIKAFSAQQKARGERATRLGREMGLTPPEEKVPTVDPNKYFVETGTRGTTRIMRRGSNISMPGMYDENGDLRAAPENAAQLLDLEPNTEFVNVRNVTVGGLPGEPSVEKQVKLLPFAGEMANVGDFALPNDQRRKLANETAKISPRTADEWKSFEGALSQFSAVNEPWNPSGNPAQAQLQDLIHSFYRELSPAGRAAMTIQIAHSLGHKVDPNRAFRSTGWASKQIQEEQARQQAPSAPATQQDALKGVLQDQEARRQQRLSSRNLFGMLSPEDQEMVRKQMAASGMGEPSNMTIFTGQELEDLRKQRDKERRKMEVDAMAERGAPPSQEPYRPKTREEAIKGFADAWRKQRGI